MGKDRLEEYIKDQVFDHHSEVDPDLIWDNIQKKKRKKRPFLWIISGLIGVIIMGIVINLFLNNETEDQFGLASESQTFETEAVSNSNYSSHDIIEDDQELILQEVKKEITESVEAYPISKQKLKSKKQSDSPNIVGITMTEVFREKVNSNIHSLLPKRKGALNVSFSKANSSQINEKYDNPRLATLGLLPQIQSSNPTNLLFDRNLIQIDSDVFLLPKETIERSENWTKAIGVSGSYLKGWRNLKSKDSLEQGLDYRLRSEKFMEEWGLGINFDLQHRSGFVISTGLNYNQINDRSILSSVTEELLVPTPEELAGTGVYQNIFVRERVRYNKIRMIDVPLRLGYSWQLGHQALSVQAGLIFNISTATKGNIINFDEFLEVSNSEYFRKNLGVSYEFLIGYHQRINDNWKLSILPSFKYYGKSFTNPDVYSIEQRYINLGLGMRLSRKF